jgi:hypothetical protein
MEPNGSMFAHAAVLADNPPVTASWCLLRPRGLPDSKAVAAMPPPERCFQIRVLVPCYKVRAPPPTLPTCYACAVY